ncbi:RNA 3'-terminal phosphate cyclase [Roseibacillus ishigakijimensis]|uniref:RNA 3'-terminal phosphate cyclase n=1 Tax=Roseibacillus ishigakijimensis TaxID=454146 RepID=A0A934RPQ5_9BACT|nr:RNA 3'-terminal phosphate cyclase [Roseibacillus ishigakijimensis]MBK1833577.1 RNA 3'-terminal phosphate cyclase [Roseibacillus ishigakijimensis]
MKILTLDGQKGGGQILRSALSLALITGQPFRLVNIRGQRTRPGLMRQHLTCVRAVCAISDGTADGAELGSGELVFRAGEVRPGAYEFAIGTAGSTTLLLQTLLPALWLAGGPSTLTLRGGTHNPLAPPVDFIERVYLPALQKMGARATLQLRETGFAPSGGGVLESTIEPLDGGFQPLTLTDRGALQEQALRVISRQIKDSVGERLMASVARQWPCEHQSLERREEGPGQGLIVLAEARYEHSSELASGCGERGQSAERIGSRVGKAMRTFHDTGAAVGRHLADQLLLPLALAGGGEFTTTAPDNHLPTNSAVIEAFLPVSFSVEKEEKGLFRVRCCS